MKLQKPYKNLNNKPKQYIEGFVEFYKLKFKVTEDVLIPRPETELLVDEVLTYVEDCRVVPMYIGTIRNDVIATSDLIRGKQSITILDLGTGAGNIAISIAKNTDNVKIIATDISDKALKIAQKNAKLHEVEDKIIFIQSNLLSVIASPKGARQSTSSNRLLRHFIPRNDNLVIVTNLPYIPSARIPYLDSSVKDHEPKIALDGGDDGFKLYRKLFAQIKEKKIKFNLLVGEIDYTHGELAATEAQKYFPEKLTEVKLDLHHRQRILTIRS